MLRPIFILLFFMSFESKAQRIKILSFKSKDSTFLNYTKPVKLSSKEAHIIITFSDLKDKNANYQVKLLGFDNAWVDIGSMNTFNYTNLFGGKYEFLVRNTKYPVVIASLKFEIEEAFWQRPWFIFSLISYVLLFGSIIFFFFKNIRLKQQNKMQGIRNEISSDLHDDVGSTLANISFLTEIAQMKLKEKKNSDVEMILEKILDDSKLMVQTMRGLIWTIKPENDDAIDFFLKVKNLASDFLSPRSINLVFEHNIDPSLKLSLEIQRNLFLVFKEATHNIVKYAKATKVKVIIKAENSWLMIQIKDNGIGINDLNEVEGNGINNIKKRIAVLDGTVEFISSSVGLIIRMAIPII